VATGFRGPKKGVLLSLGPPRWKHRFIRTARTMAEELGLKIYATSGTCRVLRESGIDATEVARVRSQQRPLGTGFDRPGPLSALDLIDRGEVDLVVNVPVAFDPEGRPDGYLVRRRAVDRGVPLITDPSLARHVVTALVTHGEDSLRARAWNDFLEA